MVIEHVKYENKLYAVRLYPDTHGRVMSVVRITKTTTGNRTYPLVIDSDQGNAVVVRAREQIRLRDQLERQEDDAKHRTMEAMYGDTKTGHKYPI